MNARRVLFGIMVASVLALGMRLTAGIIHYAAARGDVDEVRRLIETGTSNVDEGDTYGRMPLYLAVMYGNKEMVELLLEAGANVNKEANDGKTPLGRLALFFIRGTVRSLMDAGARAPEGKQEWCKKAYKYGNDYVYVSTKWDLESLWPDEDPEKNKVTVPKVTVPEEGWESLSDGEVAGLGLSLTVPEGKRKLLSDGEDTAEWSLECEHNLLLPFGELIAKKRRRK